MTCGELYPGSLQVPAMLYSKAPDGEKLLRELGSKKYIGQEKIDGAFYQLEKTDDGHIYLFSRAISKKTGELSEKIANVPHIKEWAEQLPNGTTLIGEIYVPGGKSNDTTKIMGALPEKAIERQKDNPIHYYVHDMIRYNGKSLIDTDFEHRYSDLCEHIDIECDNPDWLRVASSFTGYDMYKTIQRYLDNGSEGCVIKLKSGLYLPGKRPVWNFKVKEQVDSLDFVILDLLDPEKEYTGKELKTWKYYESSLGYKQIIEPGSWTTSELKIPITKDYYMGWKNALSVGAYKDGELVYVGRVASGLTDEMKAHMTKEPELYIGSVCEIQAMSIDKDRKTFRHPRLINMRFDKNPNECQLDEIFS